MTLGNSENLGNSEKCRHNKRVCDALWPRSRRYRKTADWVSWGMLPWQILKSRASEITGNAVNPKKNLPNFLIQRLK